MLANLIKLNHCLIILALVLLLEGVAESVLGLLLNWLTARLNHLVRTMREREQLGDLSKQSNIKTFTVKIIDANFE